MGKNNNLLLVSCLLNILLSLTLVYATTRSFKVYSQFYVKSGLIKTIGPYRGPLPYELFFFGFMTCSCDTIIAIQQKNRFPTHNLIQLTLFKIYHIVNHPIQSVTKIE